jgi:hypothetical protein
VEVEIVDAQLLLPSPGNSPGYGSPSSCGITSDGSPANGAGIDGLDRVHLPQDLADSVHIVRLDRGA